MRHFVALFGLAAIGAGPALAQTQPASLTPETAVVSPGGVDMVSGRYTDGSTDLSIGSDANGGITFTRHNEKARPFRSNWHHFLKRTCKPVMGSIMDPCTIVWELESGAISKSYLEPFPGNFNEQGIPSPGYTKLEYVSGAYRFTATDGTIYQFESGNSSTGNVWVTSVTRKDGIVYTLTYDSAGDPTDGDHRLRRVKSNTGYELILEYTGNGTDRINKACVFNTTVTTPPTANTCPAGVQTAAYTYTGTTFRHASITDALGKTWTITNNFGVSPATQLFYKPGIVAPWLTNTFQMVNTDFGVNQQQFADGRTIVYSYEDYDPQLSDPPIDVEAVRGTGWVENSIATTTLAWEAYQQNATSAFFISPAPTRITDPLGRLTAMDFSGGRATPHGHLLAKIQPSGRAEYFQYGSSRQLVQRKWEAPSNTPDAPLTTSFTYDCAVNFNCAKPITMTDPRGAVTDYTYSTTTGLMLTETLPAAQGGGIRPQKRYTYQQFQARYKNTSGTFINGTSAWLLTTISECRTGASPTCTGTADETLTSFTYPGAGTTNNLLPLSKTFAAGDGSLVVTTSWTYDADGNKLTEDGPLAGTADTSRWRYDVKRRVTATMGPDPDGAGALKPIAVINTYDDAGRLTKVENGTVNSQATDWTSFAATDSEEITYDALDRKLTAVKKSGGTTYAATQYSYDLFGRLECTAVRMDPAVFGALPASACTLGTQGSNGSDRITKNSYDLAGQLIKVTEASSTNTQADEASYAYTLNGKREYLTDARGFKARMAYDGHDRQTKWEFPDKTNPEVVSATDFEQYTLDANGNRTALRKRDGQVIAYTYDLLNRMTVKDVPGAAGDVGYTYNLLGAQTGATFTSSGQGITSAYDPLGRLTSSTNNMGGVTRQLTYLYDLAGKRVRVTHPDTHYFTYDYDPASRLTAIKENGGTVLGTFTYDSPGRPTTLTRTNGTATTYTYDPISRLATLGQDLASTPSDATFTFTYNPASQIATRALSNDTFAFTSLTANTKAYAVNGLNQYTAVGGTTHLYDPNGSLTSDGATTYAYDVENRLLSGSGAKTGTLIYDPLGRLFETAGAGGAGLTRFLYDGDELVAEYDNAGILTKRYVHGAAVDDPIVEYVGATLATRRFLHSDHQGTIVAVSDAAGNALTINRYDEYGLPQVTNAGRFGYTGQIWLPELGLWHYKARVYSPGLGRFLQVDPIGYDDQFNLYAYVSNDPINATDPDGQIIDTIADVGFIIYDVYTLATEGATTTNVAALGADVVAVVVPFATGAGVAVRASARGAEAVRAGRSKNFLKPIRDAGGHHSTFRRNRDGQITHTATWKRNERNPTGFDEKKRVDLQGKPHTNKATREGVPTPHVQSDQTPGGVRPAKEFEKPREPCAKDTGSRLCS